MAIKLVVKENGTQLWLSFGGNAMICLNNVAEERSRIIKNNMLDSIGKYLDLHNMAKEFDMLISENVACEVLDDHPISKMHRENCELKEEVHKLAGIIKEQIDNYGDEHCRFDKIKNLEQEIGLSTGSFEDNYHKEDSPDNQD